MFLSFWLGELYGLNLMGGLANQLPFFSQRKNKNKQDD